MWNKHVLSFFLEGSYSLRRFQSYVSSFQTLGAATEKARLPKLSLIQVKFNFRNNKLLRNG